MELTTIGTEIARRELELADGRIVTVLVGKPEPFPDDGGYYCPFKIEGMGSSKIQYAGGVDSTQALYLGLKMIGTVLTASEAGKAGKLTWFGNRDLGYPLHEDDA